MNTGQNSPKVFSQHQNYEEYNGPSKNNVYNQHYQNISPQNPLYKANNFFSNPNPSVGHNNKLMSQQSTNNRPILTNNQGVNQNYPINTNNRGRQGTVE